MLGWGLPRHDRRLIQLTDICGYAAAIELVRRMNEEEKKLPEKFRTTWVLETSNCYSAMLNPCLGSAYQSQIAAPLVNQMPGE
jgi:hypothetical protein